MDKPKVFVSYSSQDENLAARISEGLRAKGLDVWFFPWEVFAGDSVVASIEEAIKEVAHFVVFLSPHSLEKSWPSAEREAATVRMIVDKAHLIPVNLGLPEKEIPSLLRAKRWVNAGSRTVDTAIDEILASVLRKSAKPPAGDLPSFVRAAYVIPPQYAALSQADQVVVRLVFEAGVGHMFSADFQEIETIAATEGISRASLEESLDLLRRKGLVKFDRLFGGGYSTLTLAVDAAYLCCAALLPDFERRKNAVLGSAANALHGVTTSDKISEATGEEPWLVCLVLRRAEQSQLLSLQPVYVGHERYSIHSISPELRRSLE